MFYQSITIAKRFTMSGMEIGRIMEFSTQIESIILFCGVFVGAFQESL